MGKRYPFSRLVSSISKALKRSALPGIVIDENLPKDIANFFPDSEWRCLHISERLGFKASDRHIRRFMLFKNFDTMITRDYDFVESYMAKKLPERVVFVNFEGSRHELLLAFDRNLIELYKAIRENSLIELTETRLIIHH